MPLTVALLVLLGALLHAAWNGLVKSGADRYLDTVFVLAGAGLLILLWLPFLPLPARASWPYLAASSLIHQAYFTLIVLSYRKGDMSLVYPLMRGAAPAMTALGSAVILAEHPSLGGWIGVSMISGGVILLAFDHGKTGKVRLLPVLLALTNAAVIGMYTLSDGAGARLSGNAFSYTCWGFVFCALLFTPPALFIRRRDAVAHIKKEWRKNLLGGACSVASYSIALWAMTRAPIAAVAALRETAILFGVLIAAFTLKEQVTWMRFAAAIIVVVGAIVIKLG